MSGGDLWGEDDTRSGDDEVFLELDLSCELEDTSIDEAIALLVGIRDCGVWADLSIAREDYDGGSYLVLRGRRSKTPEEIDRDAREAADFAAKSAAYLEARERLLLRELRAKYGE